jgi:hypothetical protein
MRDLRQDPLIVRGEIAEEAVESAVIAGHEKYAGEFEIRIGPGLGPEAGQIPAEEPEIPPEADPDTQTRKDGPEPG